MPTEGCCGAPSQTESGAGKSRRKQSKWAVRGGPGLSAAAGLAQPPSALGEPSATVFNECKRGRRGLPLMLSSALEDARNRGSTSHGRPGSGRGTCPGERRQEPFV